MSKINRNKKICYILPKFDINTDTHFAHLYELIKKVSKEVDIALIIEKSLSDVSYFSDVKKIYVQKFTWLPLRLLENLFYVKLARLKGYRNFYVHYSYVGAFNASLVTRILGGRTLYWNCGMMWLFGRDKFLVLVLKMIHYLVTGAQALVPGYTKYANISSKKIKIMPNWVDIKNYQNINGRSFQEEHGIPVNKKIVLFVHKMVERKGAHHIAPTAKAFKDNPEAFFIIAGDGQYLSKLKQEIADLKIKNIKLLGMVPNRKLNQLLSLSYIYFMPSEEEGFPRTLIEAMAAGLPFVASDIGGVREISPEVEQQFIYKPGDVDGYIKGIDTLLNNPAAYEQIKAANQKHVKQYDIEVVKNKFINLFQ